MDDWSPDQGSSLAVCASHLWNGPSCWPSELKVAQIFVLFAWCCGFNMSCSLRGTSGEFGSVTYFWIECYMRAVLPRKCARMDIKSASSFLWVVLFGSMLWRIDGECSDFWKSSVSTWGAYFLKRKYHTFIPKRQSAKMELNSQFEIFNHHCCLQ